MKKKHAKSAHARTSSVRFVMSMVLWAVLLVGCCTLRPALGATRIDAYDWGEDVMVPSSVLDADGVEPVRDPLYPGGEFVIPELYNLKSEHNQSRTLL